MNEKAEKTLIGKAMDFLGSTFKAEEGAYTRGIERAADKYGNKMGDNAAKTAEKISKRTGASTDEIIEKMVGKGSKVAQEHKIDVDDLQSSGKMYAAMESVTGGNRIKDAADLEKRGSSIQRKINRDGILEAGKGYFTEPFKTMGNKEASDEARNLAKRQFIGRTGAAAAGAGVVGGIGYNLATDDDKKKTNALGTGLGVGALGTAGAAGVAMLKRL